MDRERAQRPAQARVGHSSAGDAEDVGAVAARPPDTGNGDHVLAVRGLVTRFHTSRGVVHAVNGISYQLNAGEALGIVGESGCGKSVSALSLLRLVPPPGRIEAGEILLRGRDVLHMSDRDLRDVRGSEIGMVFQDPVTSLNPVLTVGYQIAESLRRHLGMTRAAARDEVVRLLDMVGIPNPEQRMRDHPHQFSGGQRQRVMIAMALACKPSVLIADEPTTALDVTIQAQIVRMVKRLRTQLGMAILWITHDLALAAGLVDRIAVMYAGRIVEHAPARTIFARPRHPYTRGLLRSMPSIDTGTDRAHGTARNRLQVIEGRPPDLSSDFAGCSFAQRCPRVVERCLRERPLLEPSDAASTVACWRWRDP